MEAYARERRSIARYEQDQRSRRGEVAGGGRGLERRGGSPPLDRGGWGWRRYPGYFFFSSRRRHTRCSRDWSSDVCSSDLTNFIWDTAAQLGYKNNFANEDYAVGGDDHFSFIRRGVAGCDLIDFSVRDTYWHTPQDTLDKVDPRSLAIVGQVLAATLPRFEKRFR